MKKTKQIAKEKELAKAKKKDDKKQKKQQASAKSAVKIALDSTFTKKKSLRKRIMATGKAKAKPKADKAGARAGSASGSAAPLPAPALGDVGDTALVTLTSDKEKVTAAVMNESYLTHLKGFLKYLRKIANNGDVAADGDGEFGETEMLVEAVGYICLKGAVSDGIKLHIGKQLKLLRFFSTVRMKIKLDFYQRAALRKAAGGGRGERRLTIRDTD